MDLLLHSGKAQYEVAADLGVSGYTLSLWKKAHLQQRSPGEVDGQRLSPQELEQELRKLRKENDYLRRQRESLKKAMSILGEEPTSSMRG